MDTIEIPGVSIEDMPTADAADMIELALENASVVPLAAFAGEVQAARSDAEKKVRFQAWFTEKEPIIRKFLRADQVSGKRGLDAAKILNSIRGEKMFRFVLAEDGQPYKSFADFAFTRYGLNRRRAYQLSAAGGVLLHLEDAHKVDASVKLPTSERQIRALARLKDSDQIKTCWLRLCVAAPEGMSPTADAVHALVKQVLAEAGVNRGSHSSEGVEEPEAPTETDETGEIADSAVPNDSVEFVLASLAQARSDLTRLVEEGRREHLAQLMERHEHELQDFFAEAA